MKTNATDRKAAYLSKGEAALIQRALRVHMHELQVMISEAYSSSSRDEFVAIKKVYDDQMTAAEALFNRFYKLDVYKENE